MMEWSVKIAKRYKFDPALYKIKQSITFQKLVSQDFWQIANNVLNKGKTQRCYLLHLIKQKCLPKVFLGTAVLMTQASF